jgi:DNA-binding MarR family transcriptional regulator
MFFNVRERLVGPMMGMESTSLSRTLKNMEDFGLIERKADTIDKRKSLVLLTEMGYEKRKIARGVVVDFNKKLYKSIPKTKVKSFFETMSKIDNILTQILEEQK